MLPTLDQFRAPSTAPRDVRCGGVAGARLLAGLLLGLLATTAAASIEPAVPTPEARLAASSLPLPNAPLLRPDAPASRGAGLRSVGPWRQHSALASARLRAEKIERARPAAPAGPEGRLSPEVAHAAALRSARLLEAIGDDAAALRSYQRAIGLGEGRVSTWRGMARSAVRSGRYEIAEGALLMAWEKAGRETGDVSGEDPRTAILWELFQLYEATGRAIESWATLDALAERAPNDPQVRAAGRRLAWAPGRALLSSPNSEPVVWPSAGDVWLERQRAEYGPLGASLIDVLAASLERLPASWRGPAGAGIATVATKLEGRQLLVGLAATFAVLLLVQLLRQRGDLTVAIEYPEELRGLFRVRLVASKARFKRLEEPTRDEIRKGGASTRFDHHLVARETQFQRLLTRRYYVVVQGMLLDPETGEVLNDIREMKVVRVRHRRTVRQEFDVHPSECPVDVFVQWGERPASEARVLARDSMDEPVPVRDGRVRLALPKGPHRLVIGCGDRVVERDLLVSSFKPERLQIDVLGCEAVFKGCPPAVEPYLAGDLDGVARALERDGQSDLAYLLLGRMHRDLDHPERAADYFETAGRIHDAAELRAACGDFARAAALFETAEDWLRAAGMHRQDANPLRAGECFERALDFDNAIGCYREAGAVDKWISALERCGEVFEAAKLALEHEQRPRAIRLLQRVEPNSAEFADATAQLADAFEREGHYDLAAQKLDEHIGTYRPAYATPEKYARLAGFYEQATNYERALDVLEDLRRREPTFPNIASRIEQLRKQRSAAGHLFSTAAPTTQDGTQTAFVGEVRYELLEEIGRGGMGVVFRARDRRLDRIVALKRLPEGLRRHHPRALQFFLREAQSAARLNHPNIVTVYDTDQQDGHFFITMELLDGEPLQEVLRDHGRFSSESVIAIARQALGGLDFAHQQGVVHRDIKTANLFLTTERTIKIMDFGLAKIVEEVRGSTTLISGTPYYMSPEQVYGGEVDSRADLYSLGVTLFELVTGEVPFREGDVAYHHRHTAPPDPREREPEMRPGLAELIVHMLAKEPAERPQSAREVAAALREID